MLIKKMKISDLEVNEENPRKISKSNRLGLQQSLNKFGLLLPIIWNKKTKHVIGDNQKLALLKEKGETEVEVSVINLNIKEEKALNLALNNPAIQGEFTDEVQSILDELKQLSPDLYDELRLFEIGFDIDLDEEPNVGLLEDEHEDLYSRMELQPFEHYDYIIIMADNIQDWEYLREFFDLKKVDMSIGEKGKKIGIGRAVKASTFIKKMEGRE